MNLLKNTLFVALLLLFSFRFAKCQEASWTETVVTESTTVTETVITEYTTTEETTVVEEWIPQADEETYPSNNEQTESSTPQEEWFEEEEEDFGVVVTEETTTEETVVTEETTTVEETVVTEETTTVEETVVTEETTTEETPIEWVPEVPVENNEEEEHLEVCEEMPVVEEVVIVEEVIWEEGSEENPPFVEETEVNGHWMTFYPCNVSSETFCNGSYEPVCIEKEFCEAGHCRYRYETVSNVCNACKGHDNWLYSNGKCPWEKN